VAGGGEVVDGERDVEGTKRCHVRTGYSRFREGVGDATARTSSAKGAEKDANRRGGDLLSLSAGC
jgi:uncharacterized protein (DUF3084 family)